LIRLERRPVAVKPDQEYQEIGTYSFGRGVFHKTPRSGLEVGDKPLFLMKEGDFVLQITFAWEGAVALMSKAEDGLYGSVRYLTFRVDEARCFPPFLLIYFRTDGGRQQLEKISPGSAGRNRVLSVKRIPEVLVPLPPLAEQRRIANSVDQLTALINEARVLRQQTIEERQRLLVGMAHRLDLTPEEKLRSGWREVPLHKCLHLSRDPHKTMTDGSYQNFGIYSYGRGLFLKSPIDGLLTSADKLYKVKRGQFIYSRLFAFEGAYGVVSDDYDGFFISNEYPTFDCINDVARVEFVLAYFKAPHIWQEVAVGSKGLGNRRQRVEPEQILKHVVWLPPMEWQDQITAVMIQIERLAEEQSETAAKMDALVPAVLDQAVRGQL
jgi:type I restriction enzyme S subunit